MTVRIIVSALLFVATSAITSGQGNPPPLPAQRRTAGRGQQPDSTTATRAALEGQVRDRVSQMARRQLGLNDAQAEKLRQTNMKFADRRRMLMEQERDIRMSLRDEMISGDSTRQKQVGDLMNRMVKAQHQRIDLMEQEQQELATYLTPMQRARYFGLEETLRRRVDQMRQERGAGGGGRRMKRPCAPGPECPPPDVP